MARLIVQARNNEDTPTTCVRLCTSIEDVQKLLQKDGATLDDYRKRDEVFRSGPDLQWLSADGFWVPK